MKWEQVREHYPEHWVLVEAISAYSEKFDRYLEEISVISNFLLKVIVSIILLIVPNLF